MELSETAGPAPATPRLARPRRAGLSRLRRLRRMGLDELVVRGRQQASKWMDRVRAAATEASPGAEARPVAAMLLASLRDAGPDRFFEGATDPSTAERVVRVPGARDQVLAAADAACAGRFDLLGHRGLDFGRPVCWHLDATSGTRAPLVHWSRIDPLDPSAVGDSKVVWELNRHQWLATLGQAYRLTGEERYARSFEGYLRDWLRDNPAGHGINWASSLEVALRIVSWSWAAMLFLRSPVMTTGFFAELMAGIRTHAAHVERYLSYYYSPNTHLTGEALGLFYAGTLLPELRGAERWRRLGARILTAELERQVLDDGVYFEESTCYQRYTVEIALHFVALAARNGREVPRGFEERVERMLDFLLAVRQPDGTVPSIGDADGGWLLPLARRRPEDLRGVFAAAAALFRRPDYAWAAGGRPAPEVAWMWGAAGVEAFERLAAAPPPGPPSRFFGTGGYAVMRSGWGRRDHQLVFDTGPLGCPVTAGHGHADLLSIQCAAFGDAYLVDPGTGCYSEPGFRDYFRGTAAHSTVVVDGVPQAVPAGAFGWETRPGVRALGWHSSAAFDFAEAEHDGYRRLTDPVVHRRRVLFVKPSCFVVVDDLEGAAEHRWEVRFQFAPLEVTVDPSQWARAHGRDGRCLLVRCFAAVPLDARVRSGELRPIEGWTSPDYGRCLPSPVLAYAGRGRLPVRIVTVLFPVEDSLASPPALSIIPGKDRGPAGISFEDGRWVRFEGRGATVCL